MTTAVQLAQSVAPGVSLGFKNRIINGGMTIDQRNAGASVTVGAAGGYFGVDRFYGQASTASKFTLQQSTDVPTGQGFVNSLVATSSSAYSIGSGDYFILRQAVEGLNCSDFMFGSASAKTVTLSFWVKSSLTGTFSGHLTNSSSARWYPFTYTISSASTWEYKTVTIAGDTTGTWLTNNGTGIYVGWSMGTGSSNEAAGNAWTASTGIAATGSVDLVATNGATFYITGVQLEVGTAATSFEFRDYGRELALCQRYYEKSYQPSTKPGTNAANGYIAMFTGSNTVSGSQVYGTVFYKQQKRSSPTVTIYGYGGTSGAVSSYVGADQAASTGSADANGYESVVVFNGAGSWTTQNYWVLYHFTASAEL